MANSNNSTDPVYTYIKAIVLVIVYLASLYEARAQVHLVKDLSVEPQSSLSGFPKQVGNIFYFSAYTNQYGSELWRTDGTPEGTKLVKDIYPGTRDANPQQLNEVNGILYFIANDGVHGSELWRSDGTPEGTLMVHEFEEGTGEPVVLETAVAGGKLFLNIIKDNRSYLWVSDGTGTNLVTDMGNIRQLTAAGNAVYFSGDGSGDVEMWRSEGTEETTILVKDITGSNVNTSPTNFTYMNGLVYFSAYSTAFGFELWKTDGTESGTSMISNIAPGNANSWPGRLTVSGNKLYFTAYTVALGTELWVTDGTSVAIVKDISPTSSTDFGEMVGVNGSLYFTAGTSVGRELWKTDGTNASMVKDIATGPTSSNPSNFMLANGTLFFSAYVEADGVELWKTDGSASGTSMVKDIAEGMENSGPSFPFTINNNLYFWADDLSHGWELWTSTAEGETKLFKDIATGTGFSDVTSLISNNGEAWFADSYSGVWRTDGSDAGTVNIRQRYDFESNRNFLKTADALYFVTQVSDINQHIIMKSDGPHEAMALQTTGFNSISWLFEFNGVLYFAADKTGSGMELWKSNGNLDDATMVVDINPGSDGSYPYAPFVYNGALYFRANDGAHGTELWKCEGGTAIGTNMVKDIYTGTFHGNPQDFRVNNGMIYFNATTSEYGQEMWISDGTEAGTRMVADIWPGSNNGSPLGFVSLNNVVYFFAQDGQRGYELWTTDGTEEGTHIVKDIHPAADNYDEYPDWLTVVNGALYFSASDGEHGLELWKSDGTEAGTHMVKDITPGATGSEIYWIKEINDRLIFVAGNALWRSNGTECSTQPAFNDSAVKFYDAVEPVGSGSKVYFFGISEEAGAELYYYDFSNANEPGCMQTIAFDVIDRKTIGDPSFDLHATSSAGLPITFTVADNGVVSIDGNKVTINAAGQVTIVATQEGNSDYAKATAQQLVVINKKEQTITFGKLQEKIAGQLPFALAATASSGLTVSYESSDESIVTINGNTATIVGPGEVAIIARQAGNAEFSAAESVTQSMTVKVITGLEEDVDKLVSIYPNPATEYVMIAGSATRDGSLVNLMDINGRVLSSVENETTLDVRNLPVGVYLVRVTTKDFVVTKRIIKN